MGSLKAPSITAIVSLVFAVTGFSYNAWRLEQSEENYTVRNAAFEVLTELTEFEQVIYASHYDGNEVEGSPRLGWVKIGLIADLAMLISEDVSVSAERLKENWAENWPSVPSDRAVVDNLVAGIEEVRATVKKRLEYLQ